jgi:hypothetical protein
MYNYNYSINHSDSTSEFREHMKNITRLHTFISGIIENTTSESNVEFYNPKLFKQIKRLSMISKTFLNYVQTSLNKNKYAHQRNQYLDFDSDSDEMMGVNDSDDEPINPSRKAEFIHDHTTDQYKWNHINSKSSESKFSELRSSESKSSKSSESKSSKTSKSVESTESENYSDYKRSPNPVELAELFGHEPDDIVGSEKNNEKDNFQIKNLYQDFLIDNLDLTRYYYLQSNPSTNIDKYITQCKLY